MRTSIILAAALLSLTSLPALCDKADPMQGGLGKTPIFFDTFPLDDANGHRR